MMKTNFLRSEGCIILFGREEDTPPNMDPPDNEPHTQKLSKDPHEADIPDYPGINPKNQVVGELAVH